MAISLASAPQTVARFLSAATVTTKQGLESPQSSLSWSSRVSTSLKPQQWNVQQRSLGRLECRAQGYKVEIEHEGKKHMLDVPEGESILSVAIEAGITVPYDCHLGVCMTCPAKLEKGTVDQDQGMLSDDVKEQGYTLMCVAYPQSDCSIRTIPEEELLSLQLATADD
ncbi:hypothetical protein M758_5G069700 [Ceratodon purpureus]|nr:hypothetical protein M758_5G069700 [Ceratodon purpureus]